MSRRKRGRNFSGRLPDGEMAKVISAALKEDYGRMSSAVKQIANITGAKIPTVINWYQGKNLPGSRYLLRLSRASPSILRFVLIEIGGELLLDAYDMFSSRRDADQRSEITYPGARKSVQYVSENVSMAGEGEASQLNDRQLWFLSQLDSGTRVTALDIARAWQVDIRTAWRDISALKRQEQVLFMGNRRAGHYARPYAR